MIKQKLEELRERLHRRLAHDIGIDLGTANTLVYVRGRGIVINEPSVVAVNKKTSQIVEVGYGAKNMLGRTPAHIIAVKPLVHGVISDYEVAEEMLGYLISKAQRDSGRKVIAPRVVIGVPSGITNVERRAVKSAVRTAGARTIHLVEEPMAAAIGIRLPIHDPVGNMIVDIGGGTTDIAIISLGGIVTSENVSIAGERFNTDITGYIRDEFKILIGEKTAERIKIETTAIMPDSQTRELVVKGRDLVTGLPREVVITDTDVREALTGSIESLVTAIKGVIENAPPEIVADIMQRGIFLVGGGAHLRGLDIFLGEFLKLPIHVPDDPLAAVVRGTGIILENIGEYNDLFIEDDDAIPLKL